MPRGLQGFVYICVQDLLYKVVLRYNIVSTVYKEFKHRFMPAKGSGSAKRLRDAVGEDREDEDVPIGKPARSAQPAPNVRRTATPARPPAASGKQARPSLQETGDGGAGGSAQDGNSRHNSPEVACSQNTNIDCSQNPDVDTGDLDSAGFDTSCMPVSRRSGDNAKSILASIGGDVTRPFEFDKTGVGFINHFTVYQRMMAADQMSDLFVLHR